MDHPRRFKPFWRWELFLFAFVLALSMLASVVVRVDWGAWGAALTVLLLVLGVAAALLLVVPLFLTSGRDSEGSRRSLEGVAL
ncbi:MAG: hypothetical protein Q7T71_14300, partial [Herbiconiux sp.]|nr:hypothetical protein [Herbiconiux sp.]